MADHRCALESYRHPAIRECNTAVTKEPPFSADSTTIVQSEIPATIRFLRRKFGRSGSVPLGKSVNRPPRFQHFDSRIPMAGRIDTIQAMRQHSNSRKSVVQSVPVGTDIDAVSQSTHDQQVRDHFCQVFYKGFGKLSTIFGRVASTHNTDDTVASRLVFPLK